MDYENLFDFLPAEMEYWGVPGFSYGVMKDGKVEAEGSPEKMLASNEYYRAFACKSSA